MNKENKPTIVGNGKKRKDNWLTASICIDKLQDHVYEFNGKKYVNLNINIKEQPDQYGKDVQLSINDYKPNKLNVGSVSKGHKYNTGLTGDMANQFNNSFNNDYDVPF